MASSSIFNELNGKFQFKSPGFFETNSPLTSKKYEKTNNACDTPKPQNPKTPCVFEADLI